ncbi:MAG: FliM/FliN family flagellar motor switch protein [Pseudomonadota bacterium]
MARGEDTVLKRKVRGPKMRIAGFPPMDPFCNALASLSATNSRKALKSAIDVSIFGYEVVRHADYLRTLRAPSAIYLLSFPQSQGAGFIKAHPRLLSKVLDISLGGDGSFDDSGGGRALTAIDISIYGRFVDLICRALGETIAELCGINPIGPAVKTRFEEQPGMIRIAPDRSEVFVIKMNFHFGEDERGAGLDYVIPVTVLEPLKRFLNNSVTTNEAVLALWSQHMYDQVLELPVAATGQITLGDFTVGELSRLEQGMLIELPSNSVNEVQITLDTVDGDHVLSKGRLGTKGRHKALRILEDPDTEFLAPLLELERPTLPESGT